MNGKEILKGFFLALVLAPLVVFLAGMLTSLIAQLLLAGKDRHASDDPHGLAVFAAMLVSVFPCVGLVVTFVPIAYVSLPPIPSWLGIALSVAMFGLILLGLYLYHHRHVNWTPATIFQAVILLSAPQWGLAGIVLRFACAIHPGSASLIQPLLWAYGSIFVMSTTMAIAMIFS